MKKINIILIVLLLLLVSCDEDKWLEERPLSFYAVETSYETPEQFEAAVIGLYSNFRNAIYGRTGGWADIGNFVMIYPTDLVHTHQYPFNLMSYSDGLTPEHSAVRQMWEQLYKLISNANTILDRIEGDNVEEMSSVQKDRIRAQALFFRGYAYRNLGILWGGVPIVLEEKVAPQRNFVRATRDAVWAQAILDIETALPILPHVTEVTQDGRITKAAANHLLAELYIIIEEWDKAIDAASAVIDDPSYALMTERFGSRANEPGDVYWDLFRRENQNRSTNGNTESIWVHQFEWMTPGGFDGNVFSCMARMATPMYWQLRGDSDNQNLFFAPTVDHGGRGVGITIKNEWFLSLIDEDPDDIRNSEHNIIRDMVANNPASAYYGQKIIESGAINNFPNINGRWWNPWSTKVVPINNYPDEAIHDPITGETNNNAAATFTDDYVMRLAETYLLRAEAYLGKNDLPSAALDINAVRERSNASPVDPGDVNIDYILDERARELYYEELRLLTLFRTGKLVERIRIHNDFYNGNLANLQILEHQHVWPIPQSEIERNTEAVLNQNPGYPGG